MTAQLGKEDDVRIGDEPELAGEAVELGVGVPHEAPGFSPRFFAVYLLEGLKVRPKALHVGRADDQVVVALANPMCEATDPLRGPPTRVEHPSVEILDLTVAEGLDVARVLGRVVRHHYERIGAEGVDLEARAVVQRGVHRAAHRVAPQPPRPPLDVGEQGFGGRPVACLEEAEEGEVVAMGSVVKVVVYGGHAPQDLAVALCKEELHLGVLEEGVLLRVELLALIDQQRRDPVRVAAVLLERVPDESLQVASRANASNPSHDDLRAVRLAEGWARALFCVPEDVVLHRGSVQLLASFRYHLLEA